MISHFLRITKKWTLSLLLIGILAGFSPFVRAANEVPVNDAELIDKASEILEQVTKTAEDQKKATDNQILNWKNTAKVANLKKELTDLWSEKIIGYAQRPGVSFVENWSAYLKNAATRGAIDEIRRIERGPKFCQQKRVVELLNQMVQDPDRFALRQPSNEAEDECILQDGAGTDLSDFEEKGFAAGGGFAAAGAAAKPENSFSNLFFHYQQRVQDAAELAQRAAEDEALAGHGFLSTKDVASETGDPKALITTPGSIIQALTAQALGSDLSLVAGQQQMTKNILNSIGDSFISHITNEGVGGLAGIDVCKHLKNRLHRSNSEHGNDSENTSVAALTNDDCSALLRTSTAITIGSHDDAEYGSQVSEKPDSVSQLVAQINSLLATRQNAATKFKQKIKAARAFYDKFNTAAAGATPTIDPARLCRTNYYGRNPRPGEPRYDRVPSAAFPSPPAGASESDMRQRRFTKANGNLGWRPCMTQDDFDNYNTTIEERDDAQTSNKDAISLLTSFRRDVKALNKNSDTYATEADAKIAEFNTLSLKVSDSTENCPSSARDDEEPHYLDGVDGSYDADAKTWSPACFETAFSDADATQVLNEISQWNVTDVEDE